MRKYEVIYYWSRIKHIENSIQSIPLSDYAAVISGVLLAVEPAINQKEWIRDHLSEYGHDNRIGLLTGSIVPAQAYYKAQQLRNILRDQVLQALQTNLVF